MNNWENETYPPSKEKSQKTKTCPNHKNTHREGGRREVFHVSCFRCCVESTVSCSSLGVQVSMTYAWYTLTSSLKEAIRRQKEDKKVDFICWKESRLAVTHNKIEAQKSHRTTPSKTKTASVSYQTMGANCTADSHSSYGDSEKQINIPCKTKVCRAEPISDSPSNVIENKRPQPNEVHAFLVVSQLFQNVSSLIDLLPTHSKK